MSPDATGATGPTGSGDAAALDGDGRPVLRVVRGAPTEEELAALVAVLAARGGNGEPDPGSTQPAGGWRDRSRGLRVPLRHGRGAWRTSAWPR